MISSIVFLAAWRSIQQQLKFFRKLWRPALKFHAAYSDDGGFFNTTAICLCIAALVYWWFVCFVAESTCVCLSVCLCVCIQTDSRADWIWLGYKDVILNWRAGPATEYDPDTHTHTTICLNWWHRALEMTHHSTLRSNVSQLLTLHQYLKVLYELGARVCVRVDIVPAHRRFFLLVLACSIIALMERRRDELVKLYKLDSICTTTCNKVYPKGTIHEVNVTAQNSQAMRDEERWTNQKPQMSTSINSDLWLSAG